MRKATVIHSQLDAAAVGLLAAVHYAFDRPPRCVFYTSGLHDNYLIESGNERFILRAYRNRWRSPEQIRFELELLAFLDSRRAPVAGPVRTARGELAFHTECPEGDRMAALFRYANGTAPGNATGMDNAERLGRTVAETHALAAGFATTSHRPALDLPLLLDESLAVIAPFLNHAGHACLNEVRDRIYQGLPAIPRNTDTYGICTGDVNLTNYHVDGKGQLTLFDFDQCGYGYRAFEIGKFFSSVHRHGQDLEAAFLAGYQQVRPLSQAEHEAIPYFAIASLIWVMAIHAGNADLIGYKRLEPPFWERRLAILKERVVALPG